MKTDYELFNSGVCRWCGWRRKLSERHPENCVSLDVFPPNHVHEIWPGVFLGVVEARVDSRYAGVVGILSQADTRWVAGHVGMPSCPYELVDHEDRKPGLSMKLKRAFDLADEAIRRGPVLFHCHQGASRSAMALAEWRVRGGATLDETLEQVFSTRPATEHFWHGWLPELRATERRYRGLL